MVIDNQYVVPFQIDNVNELVYDYSAQIDLTDEAAYKLRDTIDQDVLSEYSNAAQTMEDSDLPGGTDNSAITASSANIIGMFSTARKMLRNKNVAEEGDFFSVVTSDTAEIIERTAADKGFQVADSTLRNGYAGNFLGFRVYVSNNVQSEDYNGTVGADRQLFGKRGAIDFAMRQTPVVEVKDVSNRLANNVFVWTVYGIKTFTNKADYFIQAPTTY